MSERALVPVPGRRSPEDRKLENRLQSIPSAFVPGKCRASAVRRGISDSPKHADFSTLDRLKIWEALKVNLHKLPYGSRVHPQFSYLAFQPSPAFGLSSH
jgi:hypothetical protein